MGKTMSLRAAAKKGGKSRSPKKLLAIKKNLELAREAKKRIEMEGCVS